jgi:hypothetical protein
VVSDCGLLTKLDVSARFLLCRLCFVCLVLVPSCLVSSCLVLSCYVRTAVTGSQSTLLVPRCYRTPLRLYLFEHWEAGGMGNMSDSIVCFVLVYSILGSGLGNAGDLLSRDQGSDGYGSVPPSSLASLSANMYFPLDRLSSVGTPLVDVREHKRGMDDEVRKVSRPLPTNKRVRVVRASQFRVPTSDSARAPIWLAVCPHPSTRLSVLTSLIALVFGPLR